jgi:hypothetical protein
MSDSDNQDQVIQLIEATHDRIAAFARKRYETYGRGVILIAVPQLASGTYALISTEMVYHLLSAVERIATDLDAWSISDGGALIRMMQTYDPATQAVVIVSINGQPPIAVKMNLDRPFVVDESETVH